MLINTKKVLVCLFLSINALAYEIDYIKLNQTIYTNIEFSANVIDFPHLTPIDIKQRYLYHDNLSSRIKFINREPLDEKIISVLEINRDLEHLQEKNLFGITTKRTHIKMYPTYAMLTHNKHDSIDRNQYSLIEPFEPVVILHTSKDKQWYYVQSSFTRGWVQKNYILLKSYEDYKKYFELPKLAVVSDKIILDNLTIGLGSRIPYKVVSNNTFHIIFPNGTTKEITTDPSLKPHPLKFDTTVVKDILESLLGQPYDWGGKYGFRDCSALIRDIFRLFGVDLPRNSKQQAEVGKTLWEGGNKDSFLKALNSAPAFCTFIHMKGHIVLFGEKIDNDYLIYHAVESLNDTKYNKVIKQKLLYDNTGLWQKAYKITTICQSI
ncbi:MAG: SH3 domain-containing protein [Calditerrivibrio sp.]|nr:SH3 domain-containing protein [Calditerrivibrio sp.]